METTSSTADQILAGLRAGRTLAEIATGLGLDLVHDKTGREMIAEPGYGACYDGADVYFEGATSARAAADDYVDGGEWGDDRSKTSWISITTWRRGWAIAESSECSWCTAPATAHDENGDRACAKHAAVLLTGATLAPLTDCEIEPVETESNEILVEIPPVEPDCVDAHEHDWQSPEWLGGLRENPGVWAHGGGVIMTEVCVRCGCGKVTDTWAQDHATGRQGLTSVEYDPERFVEELETKESES